MWKAGVAALVALIIGSTAVRAESFGESRGAPVMAEASMSLAQVSRLKTVLKLTAQQEQLWPAIEYAFREISQAQEDANLAQGFVQRMKNKAASVGLNALALRRLATAAYPLIRTLSQEQKQSGLIFARSSGLDKIAAAF
jgi:hypothetical protein